MQRKITLLVTLLFVASFGLATAFAQSNIFRLTVKEVQNDCMGVAPQKCLQVKYSNSKDWENFYGTIEGFNYQEGYQYQLRIRRTKLANVPADASSYKYKLVRIVKKTKVKMPNQSIIDYLGKYEWKLIQMNGNPLKEVQPTIAFDLKKGTVFGSSGCNRYFGEAHIGAHKITFSKMAGTMMLCEDERNNIEQVYMKLIQDTGLKYDVADQTLNFYSGDKLVLMFARADIAKH
jgi:heat shock protein HslJ